MTGKKDDASPARVSGQATGDASCNRLRDISRSLPTSLLRTREAVLRQFRPALRSVDLTEQQWRVLRALNSVPEIDATGLAMATFLLPPSLSRILRDLEKRQLITRRPDPTDLRAWLISLTDEGRATIEQISAWLERTYAAMTARIGRHRLDALMTLLHEVESDLQAPLDGGIDTDSEAVSDE